MVVTGGVLCKLVYADINCCVLMLTSVCCFKQILPYVKWCLIMLTGIN